MSLTGEIKPFTISDDAADFLRRCSEDRTAKINKILELRGITDAVDRVMAAVQVDIELSPRTTNAAMLAIIGCEVVRPPDGSTEDEIENAIALIISGLAAWNVFVTGVDIYDARTLIDILLDKILVDEVAMIPPSVGVIEIIDLNEDGRAVTHDRERFFPKPSRPEQMVDPVVIRVDLGNPS